MKTYAISLALLALITDGCENLNVEHRSYGIQYVTQEPGDGWLNYRRVVIAVHCDSEAAKSVRRGDRLLEADGKNLEEPKPAIQKAYRKKYEAANEPIAFVFWRSLPDRRRHWPVNVTLTPVMLKGPYRC